MKMRLLGTYAFVAVAGCLLMAATASADVINFETQPAGPSLFGGAPETLTYLTSSGTLTISGGTVLTATANLPADQTTVYGTDNCCGYLNTITLTFTSPISNFFMDLYNGQTHTDTFAAADNAGHSASFTIAPNTSSGIALVSFPASGNIVTVTTSDPNWDFFIDNIGFNQATPGATVPEPSSFALLGLGLAALACFTLCRQRA